MAPLYDNGDLVISVKTKNLKSGDIIAFYHGNKILVKRVIAGSGQWVVIDKKGNVILPCKYDLSWNGIHYDKKLMVFKCNKKQGLIDFDDNIVVPAIYLEIHGIDDPLLTVRDGEKDNYLEGLIKHNGAKVLEPKYECICWCKDNYLLCSFNGECEVLQYVKKN